MRKKTSSKQPADKFKGVSDKLLELIQAGTVPWRKPWTTIPYANALSGHQYRGINPLLAQIDVMVNGYQTPLFAGFAQGKTQGWKVRKGSKATWLRWSGQVCKKAEGQASAAEGATPDAATESVTFIRAFRWLQVFNLDCFDDSHGKVKIADILAKVKGPENREPRIGEAEHFIQAQGAMIDFGRSKACYSPRHDRIQVPHYADFTVPESYYSTLIHELVHWTGHTSRLGRVIDNSFGTEAYAFEELVAELGAAFVCNELGLTPVLEHHASYLDDWLSVLTKDNRAFFKATALAQKAATWLLEHAGLMTGTSP